MVEFIVAVVVLNISLYGLYKIMSIKSLLIALGVSLLSWLVVMNSEIQGGLDRFVFQVVIGMLCIIVIHDFRTKTIPDALNLGVLFILTSMLLFEGNITVVESVYAMIGATTMLVFLLENFGVKKFIGDGDYPLIGSTWMLSYSCGFISWIMVLSATGFVYALLYKILSREKDIPFAPVLVLVGIIEIVFGGKIETFFNTIFVV